MRAALVACALILSGCVRTHRLTHPGPEQLMPDDRAVLLASAPAIAAFSPLQESPLCLNTALAAGDTALSRELANLMHLPYPPVVPGGNLLGCKTAWRAESDTLPAPNTTVLILRYLERRGGNAILSLGAVRSNSNMVAVEVRLRQVRSQWVVTDTLAFFM